MIGNWDERVRVDVKVVAGLEESLKHFVNKSAEFVCCNISQFSPSKVVFHKLKTINSGSQSVKPSK